MIITLVEGGLGLPLLDDSVNWGMNALYDRLLPLGTCHRLLYEQIGELLPFIDDPKGQKVVCVGYSGGGSRLTEFNHNLPEVVMDLMILYDPSPAWQMKQLSDSIKRVITYQNASVETAMMPSPYGMLGAGVVTFTRFESNSRIERHVIREQHLAVQHDEALHTITINAIKALANDQ